MDDVAHTGTIRGWCRGEHHYTMWWVIRRAPLLYELNDVAGNVCLTLALGVLCGLGGAGTGAAPGRRVVENKHSTDVESHPPPPPRVVCQYEHSP